MREDERTRSNTSRLGEGPRLLGWARVCLQENEQAPPMLRTRPKSARLLAGWRARGQDGKHAGRTASTRARAPSALAGGPSLPAGLRARSPGGRACRQSSERARRGPSPRARAPSALARRHACSLDSEPARRRLLVGSPSCDRARTIGEPARRRGRLPQGHFREALGSFAAWDPCSTAHPRIRCTAAAATGWPPRGEARSADEWLAGRRGRAPDRTGWLPARRLRAIRAVSSVRFRGRRARPYPARGAAASHHGNGAAGGKSEVPPVDPYSSREERAAPKRGHHERKKASSPGRR